MALLFSGRGGGNRSLSWSGTWPFVKLEIFEDKIVHQILLFKTEIPFEAVIYIKRKRQIPILADGLILFLDKPDLPEFVSFFGFKEMDKAEKILLERCKNLVPHIAWHKDPYITYGLVALMFMIVIFMLSFLAGMS